MEKNRSVMLSKVCLEKKSKKPDYDAYGCVEKWVMLGN
jgi:hypothetical protein